MTNDAERVARGQRAERALDEFLRPAFDNLRTEYLRKMADIAAEDMIRADLRSDAVEKLAGLYRATEEAQMIIERFVKDGKKAAGDMLQAERYEALSPARRRLAAIGSI